MVDREGETQTSGRVARACERCRRQKLKVSLIPAPRHLGGNQITKSDTQGQCDDTRPCTMCARSGVHCQARNTPSATGGSRVSNRKHQRRPRPGHTVVHGSQGNQKALGQECLRSGASSSSIGFAANLFGDHAVLHPGDTISSIPGHAGTRDPTVSSSRAQWTLQTMCMPPASIMEMLLDAYFDRVHWFIFIFHEPSFIHYIRPLLHLTSWDEQDRGRVVTALTVAALGAQCTTQDAGWSGHGLLESSSLHAVSLRDSLIAEARFQLVNLVEECSMETVHVCLLLGTYHIYHGLPGFAWNLLGLSVRTAYALSLHYADNNDATGQQDSITTQVRRRTWNHVIVADTFAAMIYGRPSALDSSFCLLHQLEELEDTQLPQSITDCLQEPAITGIAFHVFKYRLYEIIRACLHRFRMLNLQNPISSDEFTSLVEAIVHMRALLDRWKTELPPIFERTSWGENELVAALLNDQDGLSPSEHRHRKNMYLQVQVLQLTYDSAVMFVNRPLLEYQVIPENRPAISGLLPMVHASMDLSLNAALRISKVLRAPLETQFAISFVFMNFFSAGVILCLPPTIWPFSSRANEAKAGILRIIYAVRRPRAAGSQIAEHTQQLLTRLFKLSVQQELENGLDNTKTLHSLASMIGEGEAPVTSPVADLHPMSASAQENAETRMTFSPREEQHCSSQVASIDSVDQPDYGLGYYGSRPLPEQPVIGQNEMNTAYGLNPFESGQYHQIDNQVDNVLSNFGQSRKPLPHLFVKYDTSYSKEN